MAEYIVGSKMPAQNGYGRNGACGPSSCVPGDDPACGKSGFLPACELPDDKSQTRDVGKSTVPTAFAA